jgi:hypothetical protein
VAETPRDRLREARDLVAERVPGWGLDDLIEAVDDYLRATQESDDEEVARG